MARYLSGTGLSLQFAGPIAPEIWLDFGGLPGPAGTGTYYAIPFENSVTAYSHVINADGGFESATITLTVPDQDIHDWLEYGLGRDVKVFNHNGTIVWEGFVNVVNIVKGVASVRRGPLMDVGNSVLVIYTPIIDATVEEQLTGEQTETTLSVDYDSVYRYGYLEKHLSGGQLIDADTYGTYTNQANELRDSFLQEIKDPQEDIAINYTSAQEPTITLECRGYYDWLGYIIQDCDDLSITSYVEVSVKIWETIALDPNYVVYNDDVSSLLSTGQAIAYNPLLTRLGDCQNRTAKTIIEEAVSLGDAFDKRWLFWIAEDRIAYYQPIPDEIEYKIRITDRDQNVETILGDKVYPWDVRPGKWAVMDDFLTAGPQSDQISSLYFRTDAKMLFIESVQFTAPYTLSITGGRFGRLRQKMAQLGVGG